MITFKQIKLLLTLFCLLFLITGCTTWKLGKAGQQKISGKTYVIVGASSGFGRGVAQEVGKYKANVVLAARRTDLLEEIADTIRANGGNAVIVTMDISKPEDLERLADIAVKEYSKIDVWINMAGVAALGRFWDIPVEDQARVIDVNLKGFLYGSRVAVQQFIKQRKGILINMGSVESEIPLAYQISYSASKAGVRSLGLALSQELRLNDYKDIKVVTIEPWAVDTPLWRHAANYSGVEPKMLLMDEPDKVVNAVLRKSIRPAKIVPVGWKAKGSSFFANVFPRFTEWFAGNLSHKYQIEMGPEAPDTQGSIYKPMYEGRGVDDGADERMKQNRKEGKDKKK
ncbi:SDR family NAD(P)-dependent oxidoreductase [Flavobacterium sp. MMLR14_040]|uniref:SDR family NAD(P)-dependent oxidoreductase n=1 Tax=Flavobacterium sp. MMLR14_040 TaxID=3093843 RepID=UPI00298FAF13|nr:SDR family NAD(P)-dependent oxidoreductase [Flavobacterium sp. MMLR14_040]MDW8848577.1 SDR family NAD(P)-dependent oxidoreductase [Flavobacterium sp. MMLR14_040]